MGMVSDFCEAQSKGTSARDFCRARNLDPADLNEAIARRIGRQIDGGSVNLVAGSENLSAFRARHGVPEPTACFQAGRIRADELQEATDSGKLTAFRQQHVVSPALPTSGRQDVLQEESSERITPPTSGNVLVNFRRRHLVNG